MEGIGGAVGVARSRVSHARCRAGRKLQALEAREAERPDVERRDRVDADAPFAVGPRLVEGDDAGIRLGDVEQEIPVAHLRQPRLLFRGRQAGKVVDLCFLDAGNVALRLRRQRGLSEQLRPRRPAAGNQELVGAERLAVEEHAAPQAERPIEITVRAFVRESHGIDAELFQKTVRNGTVRPWTVDLESSAVDQRQAAAELKLVALGMAAEVIMVVENEDARISATCAIEVRG